MIDRQRYEEKIMRATPFEAIKINYELIFETIEIFKKDKSPVELMDSLLQMVRSLKHALNLDEEIGIQLLLFYETVGRSLMEVKYSILRNRMERAMNKIIEVEEMLKIVYDGIIGLEDVTTAGYNPVSTVGMTYDKEGNLMEYAESTHDFKL